MDAQITINREKKQETKRSSKIVGSNKVEKILDFRHDS